jgi:predicted amidohydrolase YtcJ
MTTRWDRREFVGSLIGSAALIGRPPRFERLEVPELVLHGGHLLTMDPARPVAQAVAIAGGRFLAVGGDAEILRLTGRNTHRIDLGRKTVVPGFIDAHNHPAAAGLDHQSSVDCDLRSIGAIQQAIRERAARTPPGNWVLGFKYDDTKTAERRFLTREDLDAAAPGHPVYISHRGGHTAYVNGKAIAVAIGSESVADPSGGRFVRDESGRLTGRLLESAADLVREKIPVSFSRDDHRAGVALISKMLVRTGITSVTDAAGTPDDLRAYQDARESGELSVRVYCHIVTGFLDRMIAAGIRTGLGDEWVKVGAMKAVCDGSISERTARLSEPYVGRPEDRGILVTQPDELYAQARKGHEAGWQIGIHANGDVGIDLTLGVYERLQRELPRADPRFRLEHCTVVTPDLVRRIKALGAIPTPFSTYVYFHGEKMREYGPERLDRMFALRSFLDAGIPATMASDYPPGPFEPMMALQSMVTRTDSHGTVWGPRQKITIEEALRVATRNGAWASFDERRKGSIEAGKLADLVVLGRDPLGTDPGALIGIPIERTMVGGRWVWES